MSFREVWDSETSLTGPVDKPIQHIKDSSASKCWATRSPPEDLANMWPEKPRRFCALDDAAGESTCCSYTHDTHIKNVIKYDYGGFPERCA